MAFSVGQSVAGWAQPPLPAFGVGPPAGVILVERADLRQPVGAPRPGPASGGAVPVTHERTSPTVLGARFTVAASRRARDGPANPGHREMVRRDGLCTPRKMRAARAGVGRQEPPRPWCSASRPWCPPKPGIRLPSLPSKPFHSSGTTQTGSGNRCGRAPSRPVAVPAPEYRADTLTGLRIHLGGSHGSRWFPGGSRDRFPVPAPYRRYAPSVPVRRCASSSGRCGR